MNIIPLTTDPNQNFDITIPIDSKNIELHIDLKYNTIAAYWVITISKDGKILVDSLPLLASEYPAANILEQYKYLGVGSAYVIKTSNIQGDIPDNSNLGTDFVLMWTDTVPVEE